MEMMPRAKVLTFLLGVCSILNLGLFVYPHVVLGSKVLHGLFFAYALFGFLLFQWIVKVGDQDPKRGDKLFIRCIFAYWGIPVLFAYAVVFIR